MAGYRECMSAYVQKVASYRLDMALVERDEETRQHPSMSKIYAAPVGGKMGRVVKWGGGVVLAKSNGAATSCATTPLVTASEARIAKEEAVVVAHSPVLR